MENTNALHAENASLLHFDPIVLVRDIMKQWLLIVLVALMVGVGSYITTDMDYEPVYQTKTTFVVTCASMHQHEYVPSTYMWDYNTGNETAYEFSSNKHERGTAEAVSQELANMVNGLK